MLGLYLVLKVVKSNSSEEILLNLNKSLGEKTIAVINCIYEKKEEMNRCKKDIMYIDIYFSNWGEEIIPISRVYFSESSILLEQDGVEKIYSKISHQEMKIVTNSFITLKEGLLNRVIDICYGQYVGIESMYDMANEITEKLAILSRCGLAHLVTIPSESKIKKMYNKYVEKKKAKKR